MTIFADGRVPVIFAAASEAGPDDAVLQADAFAADGRIPGCACCLPRGAVAQALAAMFLARARGEGPYFRRVVVVASDPDLARATLRADPLVAARFRFT